MSGTEAGPGPALDVDVTTTVGGFSVTAAFGVGPGVTALFGPSGAGKSVTVATVAGLLRPQRGTIVMDGEVVADAARGLHVPTQRRRLGMVFQDAALLPHRSPLGNVALAVRGGRRGRARRALAARWLDQVRAAHLADTPTGALSGGERQRVALARALAGEPRVLLLDEPFSALDRPTRAALRRLVRELVDAHGLTALLVTHDPEDVADLADRVVRYEPGRTVGLHPVAGRSGGALARILGLGP
ncbi:MAG: ABC transporter ATP-binding protein [Acidimicrobiia bacterium]|nr:MAG: ABC transporter ATP-binding protein [Acidimicrobiia bacterium]